MCPVQDYSGDYDHGCDLDYIGNKYVSWPRTAKAVSHAGITCHLGNFTSVTPLRGKLKVDTICNNVPCQPAKYQSKTIPGRPPRGPGGAVYQPSGYAKNFGTFHFDAKPYLEMTPAFWTTISANFDVGNYRITHDPSAPKNFFKDVSYNHDTRLFRGTIIMNKIRITYALSFSLDFEKIDNVKVTLTENAQPPQIIEMENPLPSYMRAKNTAECRCSNGMCGWDMTVCGNFGWEQPGFEWYSPLVFLSHYKTQAAEYVNDPVALRVTEVSTVE